MMIFSDSFGKDSTFPLQTKVRLVFGFGTQLAGQVSPHLSEPLTRPTELTQTPSPRGICAWGSLEEYLRDIYIYIQFVYTYIICVIYILCMLYKYEYHMIIICIYDLIHRYLYNTYVFICIYICVYRYLYKANTCTYGSSITLTTNVTYARTACLFPFHFRHGPQIATLAPLSDDFHPDFWPRNLCAKNVKSFFSLGQKKPSTASNSFKKNNSPRKEKFISPKKNTLLVVSTPKW